tara:strand:+ start:997 stop:1260 length:264 start_codon:yes stop_codon:yes gene_type:complete
MYFAERTIQDLQRLNPMMSRQFFSINPDDPREMKVYRLVPVPLATTPDGNPRVRWVETPYHVGTPTPEMSPWSEKYRSAVMRTQGAY